MACDSGGEEYELFSLFDGLVIWFPVILSMGFVGGLFGSMWAMVRGERDGRFRARGSLIAILGFGVWVAASAEHHAHRPWQQRMVNGLLHIGMFLVAVLSAVLVIRYLERRMGAGPRSVRPSGVTKDGTG